MQCKPASPLQEVTCDMGSQCYLPPPGRGDISTFTQPKVVLDVATTGATTEGYRLS